MWDVSAAGSAVSGESSAQAAQRELMEELGREDEYGFVLRAKGMVPAGSGSWVYFDYVPGECDIREGKPDVTGKICVIGSKLAEDKLQKLFEKGK